MRAIQILTLLLVLVPTATGQTTHPAPLDSDRLGRKLLQQRVERQEQEIAALKAQVASLTAQLESLGMKPATTPRATAAASAEANQVGKPRRIVYVVCDTAAEAEVQRAVNELSPEQWFNVVLPGNRDGYAFSTQLVQASEPNKKKLATYLAERTGGHSNWLEAMELALKWRPNVIWFLAHGRSAESRTKRRSFASCSD